MLKERTTKTVQALLGMLTQGAMSGYDLKQAIERSIGNFWNESYGQIYPTLKAMERDGLVESAEEGKAGRTVYSLTDDGRQNLREWLGVAPRRRAARNELLLKLFFGQMAPVETMRGYVEAERAHFASEVARYSEVGAELDRPRAGDAVLPYFRITLSYGARQARMIVEWCDETLATLDECKKGQAKIYLEGIHGR